MNQRIILAGGGHAHLAVLDDWVRRPFPGTERWLVTSSRHTAYSGMLPGWMAGIYEAEDLLIDLAPLAERAGARLVIADVMGLDPTGSTITLSSGEMLEFDLLSLGVGGETNVSALSALSERLLPVRPVDCFVARWSACLEGIADGSIGSIAIVGGGAAGVELALGASVSVGRRSPDLRVSLVTPRAGLLSGHAPRVRERALQELESRGIAIHFAEATGTENGLLLSDGTILPADFVIAATGSRAPSWLARSGIPCNADGFVAVGAELRSISHPAIFAAGDIVDRVDRHLERSGVHAVKAGPVLAANLRAVVSGTQLSTYDPRDRTLYLLALGDKRAIGSWGRFAATGGWVWRIKDWIDRRFVRHYSGSGSMIGGQHRAAPSSFDDLQTGPTGIPPEGLLR